MSSLVRFIRQGWREWPELVIMGGVVLAVCPPALYSSYKLHCRTWHYRTEYTVVRDDDPYAQELRESFKDFVPHTVPKK
ncbi:uncharacterized protein LOC8038247 [Ixodes scapularis]|uniref:Secreted protein, putative n=1 Tax=Ixodes scapularis TaxID=6945 RepID=B7QAB2_IXOSC|nr:uncharacterized protein LOC8038247 [Ixodes scapularis]EEC15784.1 secreted protein, putative [Ixodes scapularis]|eukprot:XP_002400313.1 secreted protein, putative [Ixodes scapularis]